MVTPAHRLLDGRLKLRHLVLATTIADSGSLARAAEALHITQPVVTRGLQDLEGIVGVTLFDRTSQGVTVTVYGRAFVEHARAALAQIQQAGRTLGELAAADAGTVTVGTHLAGSNVLLPLAISRLKRKRPGVSIVVREATPDTLTSELIIGDVDLTVGRLAPTDARIEQQRLYVEPIVFVVRADHPVLSGPAPSMSDLAALPWIVPVEGTALRRELEQVFLSQALPWPEDRVECTSALTLRRLILDRDCVAALPELVAVDDDSLAIVSPRDVDLSHLARPVGVSRVRDRWVPPAVEAFVDELRAAAGDLRGA